MRVPGSFATIRRIASIPSKPGIVYQARGLQTVGLRYFTVYGPRQRRDMAIRRICEAIVHGGAFRLFGDGLQSRDFTYVGDAVEATVRAAAAARPAPIVNVGGGEEATLGDVIALLEALAGTRVALDRGSAQGGDVRRTSADTALARSTIGWTPRVSLREGLSRQLDWVMRRSETLGQAA
jgi:UDP-glucuronate 4-epimerase